MLIYREFTNMINKHFHIWTIQRYCMKELIWPYVPQNNKQNGRRNSVQPLSISIHNNIIMYIRTHNNITISIIHQDGC